MLFSGSNSSANVSDILEDEFSQERTPKHCKISADGKCYLVDFENMILRNGPGEKFVANATLTTIPEREIVDNVTCDNMTLVEDLERCSSENITLANDLSQEAVNIRCVKLHNINKIRFDGKLPIVDTDLPDHWCPMPDSSRPIFVQIGKKGDEFKICSNLLTENLPAHTIDRLERIQNFFLLKNYCNKKRHILKNCKFSTDLNEQLLFHGTMNRNIRDISADNLDWRLYGTKSGSAFGKGCYFTNK